MNPNLYSHLENCFPSDREQVAIQTPTQNYSWNDLAVGSAQIANVFRAKNLKPGSRVLAHIDKSPQALMLYLAALRAGLIYVPLNNAYQQSEMAYFFEDASPSIAVCSAANKAWIEPLAQQNGCQHVYTLEADGSGSLMKHAEKQPEQTQTQAVEAHDVAVIIYTSGTTGRSKGAMLTHGNLLANAQTLHDYWQWQPSDVLLHMLPVFHVHGLFVAAQGALLAGAKMIWLERFDPELALQYLPQSTLMMGVPTYYTRLLAKPEFDAAICRNMRLFISGSAPLLSATFKEFKQRTGFTILERYGLSETNMNASNPYSPTSGPRLAGTVGRALPGVSIRVVDDNDNIIEQPGTPGHIHVKGPNVFKGYWRKPEITKKEFTADGWFRTGDIGTFGGDGIPDDYLSIVGRSKDLVISGGLNVYPKEIELLIDAMPNVNESAVIGIPHPDLGEAVVAVIVPQTNTQPDLDAILTHLKATLSNFKVPKKLVCINELPRNTMGKVQKNVLREQYAGVFK
ncbi:MAG TPA: malonyl-CoA synthase [Burkholderiaceae bacterium]|nr:malonyl-CoA synthase [Burkholderiaceae bacterium]